MEGRVVALKEAQYFVHTEIPLDEHWHFLVKDEAHLFVSMPERLRTDSAVAKLRKTLIEWIFDIGD